MNLQNPTIKNLRIIFYKQFWVINILIGFLIIFSILWLGDIQFGGYDGSILINHAWQMILNYLPYEEIVTGWPPLHLIGSAIAFKLWGVKWHSLVMIAALFSFVTYLVHVFVLRELKIGLTQSILLAFTTQVVSMVVISWWWYNHITSILGVLFIFSALLVFENSKSYKNIIIFICSTSLLLLTKPNVGGILLVLVYLIFLSVKKLRKISIYSLLLSFLFILLLLFLSSINPLTMVRSYLHYGDKAINWVRILDFLFFNNSVEAVSTLIMLEPGILGIFLLLRSYRNCNQKEGDSSAKSSPVNLLSDQIPLLLGLISIFTGFWAMMSNNELNISDTPLILAGIWIIFFKFQKYLPTPKLLADIRILIFCSVLLLTVSGICYSVLRLRVKGVGVGAFYEPSQLTTLKSPALFEGLHASPRLVRVINQIEDTLFSNFLDLDSSSVFFGPRIDFGYAAYGIKPYPGLPTWWEFFKEGEPQTKIMVERFKEANFKLCIFLYHDYTYLPPSLLEYLSQKYYVYDTQDLTIYVSHDE